MSAEILSITIAIPLSPMRYFRSWWLHRPLNAFENKENPQHITVTVELNEIHFIIKCNFIKGILIADHQMKIFLGMGQKSKLK